MQHILQPWPYMYAVPHLVNWLHPSEEEKEKHTAAAFLVSPPLMATHMTTPPFTPEEEEDTGRQSTGMETQRMSLAAAPAG